MFPPPSLISRGEVSAMLARRVRGFLGKVSPSLAEAIDTPRIYRREKLPRSLPWETVKALLESIDRSTGDGLRDYTMLLLIAAYGLRVSEVAALTLDGIHWRQRWLQVPQRKSRSPLPLPLTDTGSSPNFPVKSPYGSPGSVKLASSSDVLLGRNSFRSSSILLIVKTSRSLRRAIYSLWPTGLRTRVLSRPAR